MTDSAIWITGARRSGKTARAIRQLQAWQSAATAVEAPFLALAANGDNRLDLRDRLDGTAGGQLNARSTTPLGFFQDEVILLWPQLIPKLHVPAQFPLRLRPETEQELATRLWRDRLESGELFQSGVSEYRLVRRTLDLLQLAGASGIPLERIPDILDRGTGDREDNRHLHAVMGEALLQWRQWCLDRGLLTYGLVFDLYGQHLLPDEAYRESLLQRYRGVLADDADEYPAIASDLLELFLDRQRPVAITYNPDGAVRLGLNADPHALERLRDRARVEDLDRSAGLAASLDDAMVNLVLDPMFLAQLPPSVQSIQTTARSQLLRQTAETIVDAVARHGIQPRDIAIIAPGLDPIARYTLIEILQNRDIPTRPLNNLRSLVSSPPVRALLTLLTLIYPGLGRLVDRDAVAEMLVVLSQQNAGTTRTDTPIPHPHFVPDIDPVRAGLIADRCYQPHPDFPQLLPVEVFPRWDRLGYRATTAYNRIRQWIEQIRPNWDASAIGDPASLLDRAMQVFLWGGSNLSYDRLSALRELLETAQHYWQVDARVSPHAASETASATVERFIQTLRRGTVTANPYPSQPWGEAENAVTLATIFQYRANRQSHRWHFWLDAGSPLWFSGGSAILYSAPLFLRDRSGQPQTAEDTLRDDERRLRRILLDLIGRVEERIFLCHSDLAANGTEQTGPLLALVNASVPFQSLGSGDRAIV